MHFKKRAAGHVSTAVLAAMGVLLCAAGVAAQPVTNASAGGSTLIGGLETVVVTGTAFNADSAPAKASLETTEPQTIINKSYIQDSVADTGDYTTILAIAPSMTGIDLNGPGLSDGGVKNTLRGLPDGNFGMTYDGIPFGDSNGPTHHSESYFPSSTIGSIDVDRGPGNAGQMGAATFGGSVNMFSEILTPDAHGRARATAGTAATGDFNVNYQTGDLDLGGLNDRSLINIQFTNSPGYLTYQSTNRQNVLFKTQSEIAPGWTATFFANYNGLFQKLNDNAGETAAQIVAYGKKFALQITNPNGGTFADFNHVHKKTDMDYLRLQGSLPWDITIDNTTYTYAYVNKTETALSVTQLVGTNPNTKAGTLCNVKVTPPATVNDIATGASEGKGGIPGTCVNGVYFANDVPGYTKQNAFRMWGDIFRASKDFDFGWLTGQLRAGVWWEDSASQRRRFDYDSTKCQAAGCNPWKTQAFADSRLFTGQSPATSQPFNGGFYEYEEHSNWSEYQPFVELELRPLDGLTITPGFKYVWWDHGVAAPLEQKTSPTVPFTAQFTTTRDLPFATINYKIQSSWSVYAQYAQGIYVPDISAFELGTPPPLVPGTTKLLVPPKSQTTTNYQFGTVYYADNFNIDADIYYIGVDNLISTAPCDQAPINNPALKGFTCSTNIGTAIYKGIEGEGTYAFDGVLDGLSVFMNGSLMSGKTAGKWLKQVPMWTAASGFTYKTGDFKISIIDKLVGQQYSNNQDSTPQTLFYKLPAYNTMDFKGSYNFGNVELGLTINNVLNSQSIAAIGITDKTLLGSSIYDYAGRQASQDTYSFQASRFFEGTVKINF
jgi:iron complex outermembrane receptor protein